MLYLHMFFTLAVIWKIQMAEVALNIVFIMEVLAQDGLIFVGYFTHGADICLNRIMHGDKMIF